MPAATISAIGGKARAGPPGVRTLNLGGIFIVPFGAGENLLTGNPSAPCLQMLWVATFRFRGVFLPGTPTATILCQQACNTSPRPQLIIRANPAVGINSDVVGTAPSGTGWVTITAGPFTVSSLGGTYIDLVVNSTAEAALPTLWDHFGISY